MVYEVKDVGLAQWLEDSDIRQLRAASKDWRAAVDSTLTRLRPVDVLSACRLLLPALKSLLLDHPKLTLLDPQQLSACGALTHLTQLHLGGPACFHLRCQHLKWVGGLTRLQDLKLRGCTKVRLSVVSNWHSLQQLRSLSLIGLSFTAADAPALPAFLAAASAGAGAAGTLTSLLLGDQQGLSFLSDSALQGLGGLLGGPSGCRLQVLDLSGCIELTDAGQTQLKSLGPSLHTLNLHNCMKIGPETCRMAGTLNHLTHLNLRGCCQLSDDSLALVLTSPLSSPAAAAAAAGAVCLQRLNLQSCSGLTGACFGGKTSAKSRLAALTELNMSYCSGLQAQHLTALLCMPRLRVLNLAGNAAVSGPEVLLLLGRLTGLTQLDGSSWTCRGEWSSSSGDGGRGDAAGGQEAAAAGIAEAGSNSSGAAATSSTTTSSSSSSSSPSSLLLPPNLASLKLSELNCSESLFQGLVSHLPKTLTHLDLSSCRVAGVGVQGACLKGLQGLTNLQVLNLSGTTGGLFAADLSAFLAALSGLTKLHIDHVHARAAVAVPPVLAVAGGGGCSGRYGGGETESARGLVTPPPAAGGGGAGVAAAAGGGAGGVCEPQGGECVDTTSSSQTQTHTSNDSGSSSGSDNCMFACPLQQQQQPLQPQPQQPAGVAALLVGLAQPSHRTGPTGNSSYIGSQGSSLLHQQDPTTAAARADDDDDLNPTAAMEPLELGFSTAVAVGLSPMQTLLNPAAAAALAMPSSSPSPAAATASSGAVLFNRVGSSRRANGSSSSSSRMAASAGGVRRNLFVTHTVAMPGAGGQAGPQSAAAAGGVEYSAVDGCLPQPFLTLGNEEQLGQVQDGLTAVTAAAAAHSSLSNNASSSQTWLQVPPGVEEFTVGFSPGLCDAELASLSGLTAVRSIDILACHGFEGLGFSSWHTLSHLTSLSLTGCSSLSDAGMTALATVLGQQQHTSLRELALPGCRGLTDDGVAALACVSGLRSLNLSSNRALTGRFLAHLFPSLAQLRSLNLALCGCLADSALTHLAHAPHLAQLDLHCCWRITDQGVHALLSSSTSLLHINIDGCPRLTLSSCPPQFVAVDALVGGSLLKPPVVTNSSSSSSSAGGSGNVSGVGSSVGSNSSSPSHRRPGVLIRVPSAGAS